MATDRDPDWLDEQIEKYKLEFIHYVTYAEVLARLLRAARDQYAPLAIVQSRPKSVSSFVEKAIRKAEKYDRPASQLTDLCGARVIAHTQAEVNRICRFIRETFAIDESNSEDKRKELRASEFGYLSVHYVVQLPEGLPQVAVEEHEAIGHRKAEIQVRTLLQHAWANISHDRAYKSRFDVPSRWQRRLARAAALLENADEEFGTVAKGLDDLERSYGAYMTRKEMDKEIETLRTILAHEPQDQNKPAVALRIAHIAKARWEWPVVTDVLEPFLDVTSRERAEILMEHGHAICQQCKALGHEEECKRYNQGHAEMEEALQITEGRLRAQVLTYLGWSHGNMADEEHGNMLDQAEHACRRYREAFDLNPDDPYVLVDHLGYEIYCRRNRAFVDFLRPALRQGVKVCREHADARIELPRAFFVMGRLHLLMGQPYEALAAYAKGAHVCLSEESCVVEAVLDEERRFLRRINFGARLPDEDRWVDLLLLLAKSLGFHRDALPDELVSLRIRQEPFLPPVLIIAGGTHPDVEEEMLAYADCLSSDEFEGFRGTIISGGTRAGVPGMVGDLVEKLRESGKAGFEAMAYLPEDLPKDAPEDKRYPNCPSGGKSLSPLEPLRSWIDLVAAGVDPTQVRLLGINGGKIAAFEYHLALAMGATVAVIESSGRAAAQLLPDADWWEAPRLLWLPRDRTAVKAFANPGQPVLLTEDAEIGRARVNDLGEAIHNKFLSDRTWESADPAMVPWEHLREDFRRSNIEQAKCIEEVLRRFKLGVRPVAGKPAAPPPAFATHNEEMAEMEHGRWIVERLRAGWRYGSKRDRVSKCSPSLVAWSELPEDVKKWDRDAVSAWPALLAEIGLEIHDL